MFGLVPMALAFLLVALSSAGGAAWLTHKVDAGRYEALRADVATATAKALAAAQVEAARQAAIGTEAAQREGQQQAALLASTKRQLARVQSNVKNLAGCVPVGLLGLLNEGAGVDPSTPRMSAPAGVSADACSTVGWDRVFGVTIDNYGVARQNAAQLDALTGVIRRQHTKPSGP